LESTLFSPRLAPAIAVLVTEGPIGFYLLGGKFGLNSAVGSPPEPAERSEPSASLLAT
jgi:hypothetical protein